MEARPFETLKCRTAGRRRLACGLQGGDFFRKECVAREFALQVSQELNCPWLVFFADVGDGEQDAREWLQVMSTLSCGLQIGDAALLIGRQASEAKHPANRSGHAPDDVFTEAGREQRVVAVGADGEQLLCIVRSF